MQTCKNCGHRFEGKFCNNCGQTADTNRINYHDLRHQLTHSLFHIDAGLFYTSKQLFMRPGDAIREYLEGKRVNHIKPLSYILILAGFYILVCHLLDINLFNISVESAKDGIETEKSVNLDEWFLSHFGWVTLASIPLYTVGTAVCFYGKGYNFVEYLVLNIFKAAQRLIVQIIFLPFIFLVKQSLDVETIILVIYLIDIGLNFWTNIQFFDTMKPGAVILRSFISHLILLMLMFLVIFIIMLIAPYF